MSRIISGTAGSLRLASAAKATRPTSDRVKESIFAALESRGFLSGVALDLFAGTGALGLEAASRGCDQVVFVEKDRNAAKVVAENIKKVSGALEQTAQLVLVNQDAFKFLNQTVNKFDLVFIDPPYEFTNSQIYELLGLTVGKLNQDAVVVLERASKSGEPPVPAGLRISQSKNYGDTAILWVQPD